MSTPRIFSEQPIASERLLTLSGNAARHVSKALRMQPGDTLIVFDGSGSEYEAVITEVSKSAVIAKPGIALTTSSESPLEIELWQGMSKGSRMDTVIQKATELGVQRIRPVYTDHGVVKLDSKRATKRLAHWQEIAISACEQSGRVCVPDILAPERLSTALDALPADATSFMLVPGNHPTMTVSADTTSVTLIIGPEGGFSSDEEAIAAQRGVHLVSMGERVLRTETAPLAALSILQFQAGDMG